MKRRRRRGSRNKAQAGIIAAALIALGLMIALLPEHPPETAAFSGKAGDAGNSPDAETAAVVLEPEASPADTDGAELPEDLEWLDSSGMDTAENGAEDSAAIPENQTQTPPPVAVPETFAPEDWENLPPPPPYVRPLPGVKLLAEAPVFPDAAGEEALVQDLTLLARNFPGVPSLAQETRARSLALALAISPDFRPAIVANGQLARGVWPRPLETASGPPLSLEELARRLNGAAAALSGRGGAAEKISSFLRGITASLPPEASPEHAGKDAAAADWSAVFPDKPVVSINPRAGLRLTQGSIRGIKDGPSGGAEMFTFTAQAELLPAEDSARPLLLAFPPVLAHPLKPLLDEGRSLLRERHSPWPAGWRVALDAGSPLKEDDRRLFFMGALTLLDALVSGEPLSDSVVSGVAWEDADRLRPALSVSGLFLTPPNLPPLTTVILHADQVEEITDWLVLRPDDDRLLRRLIILTARKPADVMALSRAQPAVALQRSLRSFAETMALVEKNSGVFSTESTAFLAEAVRWFPGNLSARFLHERLIGTRARLLSPRGTARLVDAAARPLLSEDRKRFPLRRPDSSLEKTSFAAAWDAIGSRRAVLDSASRAWLESLEKLAGLLDRRVMQPPATKKYIERSDLEIKAAQAAARQEAARFHALRGIP